jgi:hypothetical protein
MRKQREEDDVDEERKYEMQRGIPESGEQGEEQRTQEGGQSLAQVPVPRMAPVVYS